MRGLCMDCAWITHGLCMDYAWIMYGLCMDYEWIMHGLCKAFDAWIMHTGSPRLQDQALTYHEPITNLSRFGTLGTALVLGSLNLNPKEVLMRGLCMDYMWIRH